jgi:hypothetical protein
VFVPVMCRLGYNVSVDSSMKRGKALEKMDCHHFPNPNLTWKFPFFLSSIRPALIFPSSKSNTYHQFTYTQSQSQPRPQSQSQPRPPLRPRGCIRQTTDTASMYLFHENTKNTNTLSLTYPYTHSVRISNLFQILFFTFIYGLSLSLSLFLYFFLSLSLSCFL